MCSVEPVVAMMKFRTALLAGRLDGPREDVSRRRCDRSAPWWTEAVPR